MTSVIGTAFGLLALTLFGGAALCLLTLLAVDTILRVRAAWAGRNGCARCRNDG